MILEGPTTVAEESTDNLVFTVTRTGSAAKAITVNLTYGGTATYGSDYAILWAASVGAGVATVFLPAGVSSVELIVDPTDDAVIELQESVLFTLQPGDNYVPLLTAAVAGAIVSGEDDADYGDAPAPYRTTFAQGGAVHLGNPGPWLGATLDFDADGVPSTNADGDGGDEDGVLIAPLRAGQRSATIAVTASNVAAGARLDAWIDFDGDGSWGDGDERIAHRLVLSEGVNVLTVDVPVDAATGAAFARFRVSTAGGLGVAGIAQNGEVEDYLVNIAAPLHASGVFAPSAMVEASAAGAHQLISADLDGDGDLDLVAATSAGVLWYERGVGGVWNGHALPGNAAGAADSIAVADIDGDGDVDVLTASSLGQWIAWLENDGAAQFTVRTISTSHEGVSDLEFADLDGDGDLDFVALAAGYHELSTYRNNGLGAFTRRSTTVGGIQAMALGDGDRDGDVDILIAKAYGSDITIEWLTNSNGAFTSFLTTSVSEDDPYADSLALGDMNGDGQLDVIAASSTTGILAWYDRAAGYTRSVIATLPQDLDSIAVADVTGDGRLDVVAVNRDASQVLLFENAGEGGFASHTAASLDHAACLSIADFDGDGDLDFAAGAASQGGASSGPYAIQIYDNADSAPYLVVSQDALSEESGIATTFAFMRKGRLGSVLAIPFTVSGTAEWNVDYVVGGADAVSATQGVVTLPSNAAHAFVNLAPLDDSEYELDETIILTLAPEPGSVAATPSSATVTLTSAELAGDYDADGIVTGNDFLAWQRQLGAFGLAAGSGADGSRNGAVDAADLDVWRTNVPVAAVAVAVTAAAEGDAESSVTANATQLAGAPIAASASAARGAQTAAPKSAAQRTAALDALYAAGDFTGLIYGRETFRPLGRPRLRPALR
jgi:hypothetical protein